MTSRLLHPNRQLLFNEDAFTTPLLTLLIDQYGVDGLSWTYQTIKEQLEEDLGVQNIPKSTMDKIMAGVGVLTTDYFFSDPRRFIELANILAGDDFDPTTFDPADVAECAWAVTEVYLLDPWEPEEDPFSPEVKAYVGAVIDEEGFVKVPKILSFALRDNLEEFITFEHAEDPELFQSLWVKNEEKTTDIDRMIRENLELLSQQLASLHLKSGSTKTVLEGIRKQLA